MTTLFIIGLIVAAVASVILILTICMQEPKNPGLGSLAGQTTSFDTKSGRYHARTKEQKLVRITCVIAIILGIVCILLNCSFIKDNTSGSDSDTSSVSGDAAIITETVEDTTEETTVLETETVTVSDTTEET